MLHTRKETHRGWTWRVVTLGMVVVALLGLLAACGGDDDTPTPTTQATTDTGDGGTTDGGTTDGDNGMTAEEAFFAQDWEFIIPSSRFYSWSPVTIKRIIDDNLPNVRLTIQDASSFETLRDYEDRPETKATNILQHSPKVEDGFRAGINALPAGVPHPSPAPRPMWGIYPYSQMQLLTQATTGINSVLDFDGKVVSLGGDPDSFNNKIYEEWIELAGVKPRIVVTTQDAGSGLMEGNFEVASSGIVFQLTTSGNLIPFQTSRELRIIDWRLDILEQQRALHPEWDFMVPVKLCNSAMRSAMNLDYDVIDPTYVGTGSSGGENCNVAPGGQSVMYSVLEEFPEEGVYQMTKALLENMADLELLYPGAPWAGKVFSARFAHSTERQEFFHPGAVRAFEEMGWTYGQEGVDEWTSQRTDPARWWTDFLN